MSSSGQHEVVQGESVESIAHAAGHLWETVWEADENAELRERRTNAHVIMPGDRVFVPPIEPRTERVATGQRHTVRRKGIPSKLVVRFLVDGEPRADAAYTFVTPSGERSGSTDGDGMLDERIDPLTPWAEVRFELETDEGASEPDDEDREPADDEVEDEDEGYEEPEPNSDESPPADVFRFELRRLDPVAELSGAQARLHLLGYGVGQLDGELGPRTQASLRGFQAEHELDETGELDDATQAKLAEYCDG